MLGDCLISLRDLFENNNAITPQLNQENITESIEMITQRDMPSSAKFTDKWIKIYKTIKGEEENNKVIIAQQRI